jgi:hypothetical protein
MKRTAGFFPNSNRFNLGELFDHAGRLRPPGDLPPALQNEIASFEVVRITTRGKRETVTTEELIRVKTRDRRTAQVSKRDGTWVGRTRLHSRAMSNAT